MLSTQTRWFILAVGMIAQSFTSMLQFGLPFLRPQFRSFTGSDERAALLIAASSVGLMLTLVAWGWCVDRFGERRSMVAGLLVGSVTLGLTSGLFLVDAPITFGGLWVALCCSSALLAAVNSASARLIMAWFPSEERGLAMGIRQTSQPVGVAVSAACFPAVAISHGLGTVLGGVAVGCLISALLILIVVPSNESPRIVKCGGAPGVSAASPYRTPMLWQVHGASALLTIAQFTFSVFGFVYLTEEHRWNPVTAGLFFTTANLVGAACRVVFGWYSDRFGSRLTLLRQISWSLAAGLFAVSGLSLLTMTHTERVTFHAALLLILVFLATVVASSNNGLSYTLVAEYAGPFWTGRALGTQNTVQNLVGIAVPVAGTAGISLAGFPLLFFASAFSVAVGAVVLPKTQPSEVQRTPGVPRHS